MICSMGCTVTATFAAAVSVVFFVVGSVFFTVAMIVAVTTVCTAFAVTIPFFTVTFLLSDFHVTPRGSVLSYGSKETVRNACSPPFMRSFPSSTASPAIEIASV